MKNSFNLLLRSLSACAVPLKHLFAGAAPWWFRRISASAKTLCIPLCAVILVLTPRIASACATCRVSSNSDLATATDASILFLMAVVSLVMIGVSTFVAYLWKRSHNLNNPSTFFQEHS